MKRYGKYVLFSHLDLIPITSALIY